MEFSGGELILWKSHLTDAGQTWKVHKTLSKHWMLAIMDIIEHNVIYWFDPIGNSAPSRFKNLINTSIRVFAYRGGVRKSTKQPQWIKVNCARQQGVTECGFYVMRYMLEVVSRPDQRKPIDKHFEETRAYSDDEIDEIQDLWVDE